MQGCIAPSRPVVKRSIIMRLFEGAHPTPSLSFAASCQAHSARIVRQVAPLRFSGSCSESAEECFQ